MYDNFFYRMNSSGEEFYVDWENACCGVKKSCQKTKEVILFPKGGFAVHKIDSMVVAGPPTDFQAEVLRRFGDR